MSGPPYSDDPTVLDDDPLWRRIPPQHFIHDANLGGYRASSAAFENHPDGSPMSVVLGNDVLSAGRLPESVLVGHEGFGLVAFNASVARSAGQGIVRKPEPDEPAHAEVFGKKTDAVKKKLYRNSTWVIPPPAQQTGTE